MTDDLFFKLNTIRWNDQDRRRMIDMVTLVVEQYKRKMEGKAVSVHDWLFCLSAVTFAGALWFEKRRTRMWRDAYYDAVGGKIDALIAEHIKQHEAYEETRQ